jgi:hypothetical protein
MPAATSLLTTSTTVPNTDLPSTVNLTYQSTDYKKTPSQSGPRIIRAKPQHDPNLVAPVELKCSALFALEADRNANESRDARSD